MNTKLIFAITGVVSAAAGALVSWAITKRHYNKEMDAVIASCENDVTTVRTELKKYKKYVELMGGLKQDIWENVDALAPAVVLPKSEDPEKDKTLNKARKESEYTDYTKHFQAAPVPEKVAKPDEPFDPQKPVHMYNSIKYISDWEYDTNEWGYEREYLNYYLSSKLLYTDHDDEMIDTEDVMNYIGEPIENLRKRIDMLNADNPNHTEELYILNEQHEKIYCITQCAGVGPRP